MKTTKRRAMAVVMVLVLLVWNGIARGGDIHDAAAAGDVTKVKTLLAGNPDLVNARGDDKWERTPLLWAVVWNKKDVVEILLANKADVNAKDKYGRTSLHAAAMEDYKDIAKLLLANKADVNARDDNGWTPLYWAAVVGNKNIAASKDMAELLLANKADINAKAKDGTTPLCWASNKDMAEFLLANKADVNAKNNAGETPLSIAEKNGRNDVVEILRQHGGLAVSTENKVTENVPKPPAPPAPAQGIQIQKQIEPPEAHNDALPVNLGDAAQVIEKIKGAKIGPEMFALVKNLSDIGKPAAKEVLKAFQDKNNVSWVREIMAEILPGFKDKETIPGIVEVLQDKQETPYIRSKAAFSLGMMGLPEASAPLIGQLKNDDSGIRSMAVFSLGLLKDQSAISAIGEMTKDKDWLVRNRAARALGMLGNPAGIEYLIPLLSDNVSVRLETIQSNNEKSVRLAAIQSLGIIGTDESVNPLADRLKVATDQTEKAILIQALGKTKNQKAADPLLNILQNEDEYFAMNAAEALSLIGNKRAVPLIESRIKTARDSFAQKKFREAYKKLTGRDFAEIE